MASTTLGFLGGGHMARAIIAGLLADDNQTFTAKQIIATCHSDVSAQSVAQTYGIACRCDNRWLVEQADVIVLGVRPQQMRDVLQEISTYDLNEKIIITLAAAIDSAAYRKYIGDELPLIRAMPNIAAAGQASMTGIYSDQALSEDDSALIETLFSAVGDIAWLDDEIQIDGIMALSGSGIAYLFRFMQAMAKAGEQYGFERDEVYDLVTLTAMGAATLALENNADNPNFADLCRSVAVEGGTTAKAIATFEQAAIDDTTAQAMNAVVRQAATLQQTLTQDW